MPWPQQPPATPRVRVHRACRGAEALEPAQHRCSGEVPAGPGMAEGKRQLERRRQHDPCGLLTVAAFPKGPSNAAWVNSSCVAVSPSPALQPLGLTGRSGRVPRPGAPGLRHGALGSPGRSGAGSSPVRRGRGLVLQLFAGHRGEVSCRDGAGSQAGVPESSGGPGSRVLLVLPTAPGLAVRCHCPHHSGSLGC